MGLSSINHPAKTIQLLGIPHLWKPPYAYICVNYNDLTVLPHWNPGFYRGIIPKWPKNSGFVIPFFTLLLLRLVGAHLTSLQVCGAFFI